MLGVLPLPLLCFLCIARRSESLSPNTHIEVPEERPTASTAATSLDPDIYVSATCSRSQHTAQMPACSAEASMQRRSQPAAQKPAGSAEASSPAQKPACRTELLRHNCSIVSRLALPPALNLPSLRPLIPIASHAHGWPLRAWASKPGMRASHALDASRGTPLGPSRPFGLEPTCPGLNTLASLSCCPCWKHLSPTFMLAGSGHRTPAERS